MIMSKISKLIKKRKIEAKHKAWLEAKGLKKITKNFNEKKDIKEEFNNNQTKLRRKKLSHKTT